MYFDDEHESFIFWNVHTKTRNYFYINFQATVVIHTVAESAQ